MYSYEIEEYIKLRNNLLNIKEYIDIIQTSPQIDHILYKDNNFEMYTNDCYKFKFKIKEIKKD
jgi:hypothetical protein